MSVYVCVSGWWVAGVSGATLSRNPGWRTLFLIWQQRWPQTNSKQIKSSVKSARAVGGGRIWGATPTTIERGRGNGHGDACKRTEIATN